MRKMGEFIQKFNKKIMEPTYSRLILVIVIFIYLFVAVKNNKNSIKNKLLEINNLKKNINLPVDVKSKQDLEDFIIKGRNVEYRKKESKKQQSIKTKNILIVDANNNLKKKLKLDKDSDFQKFEKELDVNNPSTFAYKMKQLDLSYSNRLKKRQINKKQKIKMGNLLYVSLFVENNNLIELSNESKNVERQQKNRNKMTKTIMLIDKTVPISQFFIGRKVGSIVKVSVSDIVSILPENQQISYKTNVKQLKDDMGKISNTDSTDFDKYTNDSKIYLVYTVLDIVPMSVRKKLKLDK